MAADHTVTTSNDIYHHVTITVTGAGGVIHNEMEIIKQALAEFGYEIVIKDAHPRPDTLHPIDLVHFKTRVKELFKHRRVATIVADHLPWGG